MTTSLSTQLITIANILSIDIHGTTEEIANRILIALSDIAAFKETFATVSAETELDDRHSTSNTTCGYNTGLISSLKIQSEKTVMYHPHFASKHIVSFNDIEHLITPYRHSKSENIQTWFLRLKHWLTLTYVCRRGFDRIGIAIYQERN